MSSVSRTLTVERTHSVGSAVPTATAIRSRRSSPSKSDISKPLAGPLRRSSRLDQDRRSATARGRASAKQHEIRPPILAEGDGRARRRPSAQWRSRQARASRVTDVSVLPFCSLLLGDENGEVTVHLSGSVHQGMGVIWHRSAPRIAVARAKSSTPSETRGTVQGHPDVRARPLPGRQAEGEKREEASCRSGSGAHHGTPGAS